MVLASNLTQYSIAMFQTDKVVLVDLHDVRQLMRLPFQPVYDRAH